MLRYVFYVFFPLKLGCVNVLRKPAEKSAAGFFDAMLTMKIVATLCADVYAPVRLVPIAQCARPLQHCSASSVQWAKPPATARDPPAVSKCTRDMRHFLGEGRV